MLDICFESGKYLVIVFGVKGSYITNKNVSFYSFTAAKLLGYTSLLIAVRNSRPNVTYARTIRKRKSLI